MSRDKDQSLADLRRQAEQLEVSPSAEAWNRLERKLDRRRDRGGLLVPLRPWLRAAAVLLVIVVAAVMLWPEAPQREAAFAPQTVSIEFVATEPSPGELARIAEARSAYRRSLAWVESADASGGELLALNVAPGTPGTPPKAEGTPGIPSGDQTEGTPGTPPGDQTEGTPGILPGDQTGNTSPQPLAQADKRRQTPALGEEAGESAAGVAPERALEGMLFTRKPQALFEGKGENKGVVLKKGILFPPKEGTRESTIIVDFEVKDDFLLEALRELSISFSLLTDAEEIELSRHQFKVQEDRQVHLRLFTYRFSDLDDAALAEALRKLRAEGLRLVMRDETSRSWEIR